MSLSPSGLDFTETVKSHVSAIKSHVNTIRMRLNASDRTQAAVTALQRSLVPL